MFALLDNSCQEIVKEMPYDNSEVPQVMALNVPKPKSIQFTIKYDWEAASWERVACSSLFLLEKWQLLKYQNHLCTFFCKVVLLRLYTTVEKQYCWRAANTWLFSTNPIYWSGAFLTQSPTPNSCKKMITTLKTSGLNASRWPNTETI